MEGEHIMAIEATKDNLKALTAEGTVVVDFWAPWCGPCKVLDPMLTALEQELPALKVVRYNVEKDHTLPSTMGIMSVDRKSTRLNSSHSRASRMPSSA